VQPVGRYRDILGGITARYYSATIYNWHANSEGLIMRGTIPPGAYTYFNIRDAFVLLVLKM
jgi:hypothetical protein